MNRAESAFSIASGAAVSGTIELSNDTSPVALVFPVAPTNTSFGFEEYVAGAWHTVKDEDGSDYTVATGAAGYFPLNLHVTAGLFRFRLKGSGNEAATRSGYVITRKVS